MTAALRSTVDGDRLRMVMRRHASTVTVVTAPGQPPVGFTATSFMSVSLDPPLISFYVGRGSSSWPTVREAGHVAVHLLGPAQQAVARQFATRGIDRFAAPTRWRTGPHQVPILEDTVAWLLCRVVDRFSAGDHTLVLAEPVLTHSGDDRAPLLYHDGRYTTLEEYP
jgi:flavin reductase (DIM6/NTAB) family NADH-FMN oxidoreductase RutF